MQPVTARLYQADEGSLIRESILGVLDKKDASNSPESFNYKRHDWFTTGACDDTRTRVVRVIILV